jgi:hypothetical protein
MKQMIAEFTRVTSKESLLLKVADAAVRRPDDTVRQVVYPVLGEDNLRNLAAEFKASRSVIATRTQATYRESYTQHYRRGLVRVRRGAGRLVLTAHARSTLSQKIIYFLR